jgi:hypothetical protein
MNCVFNISSAELFKVVEGLAKQMELNLKSQLSPKLDRLLTLRGFCLKAITENIEATVDSLVHFSIRKFGICHLLTIKTNFIAK